MKNPNVLLVVMDAVRGDDIIGNAEVAPFIQDFADREEATTYTEVRSPGPWTVPSHASIFTGKDPQEHLLGAGSSRVEESVYKELRDDLNYRTGLFTENPFLSDPNLGLNTGFSHINSFQNALFDDGLEPQRYAVEGDADYWSYLMDSLRSSKTTKSLLNGFYSLYSSKYKNGHKNVGKDMYQADSFIDWVKDTDGHWAAAINLVSAHSPYLPADEDNIFGDIDTSQADGLVTAENSESYWKDASSDEIENAHNLYLGCIKTVDRIVGSIIKRLEDIEEYEDTLIVLTSDHGESFGEADELGHNDSLRLHRGGMNEENLHIPLYTKIPNDNSSKTIDQLATITKFRDVIMSVLRGDSDDFTSNEVSALYEYGSNFSSENDVSGDHIQVLYREKDGQILKYIRNGRRSACYNVKEGNKQQVDKSDIEIRESLDEYFSSNPRGDEAASVIDDVSGSAEDRLEHLGYK